MLQMKTQLDVFIHFSYEALTLIDFSSGIETVCVCVFFIYAINL